MVASHRIASVINGRFSTLASWAHIIIILNVMPMPMRCDVLCIAHTRVSKQKLTIKISRHRNENEHVPATHAESRKTLCAHINFISSLFLFFFCNFIPRKLNHRLCALQN